MINNTPAPAPQFPAGALPLKPCPWCDAEPRRNPDYLPQVACEAAECPLSELPWMDEYDWNRRDPEIKGQPTSGPLSEKFDDVLNGLKPNALIGARLYGRRSLFEIKEEIARLRSIPAPASLVWTKEKPTEGDNHYHFREKGGKGRTVIFLSGDGDESVTFYNGRREYLGNIHGEFAGPIPTPSNPTKGDR